MTSFWHVLYVESSQNVYNNAAIVGVNGAMKSTRQACIFYIYKRLLFMLLVVCVILSSCFIVEGNQYSSASCIMEYLQVKVIKVMW